MTAAWILLMRIVADAKSADLSIILVHGTWGRGFFPREPSTTSPVARRKPRWFEPGSNFRTSLEEALRNDPSSHAVSIGFFEWSGANSFVERANAGAKLAQWLDAAAAVNPEQTQILIGHSHGGSVCMLASRSLTVARPHIVTLATPFIELDASDAGAKSLTTSFSDQLRRLSLATFFGAIAISGIGGITSQVPGAWLKPWWVPYLLALPFVYMGLDAWAHWSRSRLHPAWAGGGLMQRYAWMRMLVLRGVDDEASMTLTAAAIANRLCQPIPFLAALVFWLTLLALVLIYSVGISLPHIDGDLVKSTVLRWLPLVWLLDVISGLLMAASGRELALWFHGLQIRSHSSPDHGHHLSVFTLPYRGRKGLLRHGLYDHRLVPTFILLWMNNDFDLSPADLDVSASPGGGITVTLLPKPS